MKILYRTLLLVLALGSNLKSIASTQEPDQMLSSEASSACAAVAGVVKWFNDARGYGFITPESGGEEIYVHHTAIQMEEPKTLKEGQRVCFVVELGPKGKVARDVSVMPPSK